MQNLEINSAVAVFFPDGIRFGKLVEINERRTKNEYVISYGVLFEGFSAPVLCQKAHVTTAPSAFGTVWSDFDKAVQNRRDLQWAHGVLEEQTTTMQEDRS